MSKEAVEWFKQFFLKALYGALASVAAGLLAAVSAYEFQGGDLEQWVWNAVVIGGLTGAVAVLKRLAAPYRPDKEGQ